MLVKEDVDTLLGPYETRYFGAGHKKSDYKISEGTFIKGTYMAIGAVEYDDNWSKKKERILEKHLSTIDGIILSVMLVEKYLLFQKMPIEYINKLFLSSFEVKAGPESVSNLNILKVKLKKIKVSVTQINVVSCIENMEVKLSFVIDVPSNSEKYSESVGFIENHLKYKKQEICNIDFQNKDKMTCSIKQTVEDTDNFHGIQSSHSTFISILEWLVSFAQMSQMLAYHYDNIRREDSDNLWMRQVKAVYTKGINKEENDIETIGEIIRAKKLSKNEKTWRTFSMSGHDIENRIFFEAKLAHQLPEETI